jgi:hypothetical protein
MVISHSYVSLPEGNKRWNIQNIKRFWCEQKQGFHSALTIIDPAMLLFGAIKDLTLWW